MPFDYKKEYKEFYLPPKEPEIVEIPAMNFVAVRGAGNPNETGGDYQKAMQLLYGVSFTIKMSYKGSRDIEGYFPYVVPPLEGLWWQDGVCGVDYGRKEDFQWISMIRLPEFVTEEVFQWAGPRGGGQEKDRLFKGGVSDLEEGRCVQCCTWVLTTMNRPPLSKWTALPRSRAMLWIFLRNAAITRSIWAIRGEQSLSG